jgi:hypothetical protein
MLLGFLGLESAGLTASDGIDLVTDLLIDLAATDAL